MLARFGRQRGDTLIEVMFAFGVFSLVAVSALTIMNRAQDVAQDALYISLARQAVNDQAETIRFLHDSYVASYIPGETFDPNAANKNPAWQWQNMVNTIQTYDIRTATNITNQTSCPQPPNGSFLLNTNTAHALTLNNGTYQTASSYAHIAYPNGSTNNPLSYGIWIEAIRSTASSDPSQSNLGYIDFHIMACWPATTGDAVPSTLATIVRLYEPR